MAAVLSGQLEVRGLFTHAMPLTELATAYTLLEERPAGFLKATVLMP